MLLQAYLVIPDLKYSTEDLGCFGVISKVAFSCVLGQAAEPFPSLLFFFQVLKYMNNRCEFKMGAEINASSLETPAPGWNHGLAPV